MLTVSNFTGMDALRVHAFGDSITAGGIAGGQSPGAWGWPDAPGGLYDTITPLVAAKTGADSTVRPARTSGSRARLVSGATHATALPTSLKPAQLTKNGKGGTTVTYVSQQASGHPELIDNTRWAEFITERADLFICNWAINDFLTQSSANQLAAYGAMMDKIHTDYPDALLLCLGCLFINEAWASAGGNHYTGPPNPFDANNFADQNIAALCAARPGWSEYCPLVTNALAYTVAHEPEPGPNGGVGWPGLLSMNGLHPTLLGQQKMGEWAMAHLNFVVS